MAKNKHRDTSKGVSMKHINLTIAGDFPHTICPDAVERVEKGLAPDKPLQAYGHILQVLLGRVGRFVDNESTDTATDVRQEHRSLDLVSHVACNFGWPTWLAETIDYLYMVDAERDTTDYAGPYSPPYAFAHDVARQISRPVNYDQCYRAMSTKVIDRMLRYTDEPFMSSLRSAKDIISGVGCHYFGACVNPHATDEEDVGSPSLTVSYREKVAAHALVAGHYAKFLREASWINMLSGRTHSATHSMEDEDLEQRSDFVEALKEAR